MKSQVIKIFLLISICFTMGKSTSPKESRGTGRRIMKKAVETNINDLKNIKRRLDIQDKARQRKAKSPLEQCKRQAKET